MTEQTENMIREYLENFRIKFTGEEKPGSSATLAELVMGNDASDPVSEEILTNICNIIETNKNQPTEFTEIGFTSGIEIIRKRFPVSVDIEETELNMMKKCNYNRILLKKQHYNEYCLVELHKGTNGFGFTIFKSNSKDFEKIETDFQDGFSFAPKYCTQIEVIMNTLV